MQQQMRLSDRILKAYVKHPKAETPAGLLDTFHTFRNLVTYGHFSEMLRSQGVDVPPKIETLRQQVANPFWQEQRRRAA